MVQLKSLRSLIVMTLVAGVLVPLPVLPCSIRTASAAQDEPVPPAVKESIDRALAWLAENQKPDGTFPQGDAAGTTAVPSLCVLAFMARGHVPGQGRYGEVIYKSIDYVIAHQQENGLLSSHINGNHSMYEHGISSVMLAECYGMVDDARREKIGKALAKGTSLILQAQRPYGKDKPAPHRGGWRYSANSSDSDISVTGWQMMALRGAANCGANIPRKNLEEARAYVQRIAVHSGGFSYQGGEGANQARSGTGILMLELFRGLDTRLQPGEHPPEAIAAGNYLLTNPPDNPNMEFYYYGVYYCSQALNQLGGKYWDEIYIHKLRDTLMAQQSPAGTFDGGGSGQELQAGPSYRTAMACLALCVPYRYLPIYQRDD